jgi:hypothetical protein
VLPLLLCAWFVVVIVATVLDALVVTVVVVIVLLPLAGAEQPHFVAVELPIVVIVEVLDDNLPSSTLDDG